MLRYTIPIMCNWSMLKCVDISMIVYVVQVHFICLQSNAMKRKANKQNRKKRILNCLLQEIGYAIRDDWRGLHGPCFSPLLQGSYHGED